MAAPRAAEVPFPFSQPGAVFRGELGQIVAIICKLELDILLYMLLQGGQTHVTEGLMVAIYFPVGRNMYQMRRIGIVVICNQPCIECIGAAQVVLEADTSC